MFIYETTQELMSNLAQNAITSVTSLDATSRDMLIQLFALIDASFTWEFTSSKRKPPPYHQPSPPYPLSIPPPLSKTSSKTSS